MCYLMKKRAYYRQFFAGSELLFKNCWAAMMKDVRAGGFVPTSDKDVASVLRKHSAAKIANPRSKHSIMEVLS